MFACRTGCFPNLREPTKASDTILKHYSYAQCDRVLSGHVSAGPNALRNGFNWPSTTNTGFGRRTSANTGQNYRHRSDRRPASPRASTGGSATATPRPSACNALIVTPSRIYRTIFSCYTCSSSPAAGLGCASARWCYAGDPASIPKFRPRKGNFSLGKRNYWEKALGTTLRQTTRSEESAYMMLTQPEDKRGCGDKTLVSL